MTNVPGAEPVVLYGYDSSGNLVPLKLNADGTLSGGGSSGAPTDASYVVGAANSGLSAELVLGTGVVMKGAYSALPAAGLAGRIYICTDSLYWFRDNGTTWDAYFGSYPVTQPPSSGWSWDNQVSSTIDSSKGFEFLNAPRQSAIKLAMRYRTPPATPYTIEIGALHDIGGAMSASPTAASSGLILGWRDSTGKFVSMDLNLETAGQALLAFQKWTDSSTFSANYNALGPTVGAHYYLGKQPWWVRLRDDGTNLIAYLSPDGLNWAQFDSRARTDFMASGPNGLAFGAYVNGDGVLVSLFHWKQVA